MEQELIHSIASELRIKQCLRDISTFWSFRSTVPGPGLREASKFICKRHQENGVEAEVISYPADDKTEWLHGHRNSLEWIPRSASLSIVRPESASGKICSYEEEPLSLVCNSTSTPKEGIFAEVVIVNGGSNDVDYDGIDVRGKIIFTNLPAGSVEAQARKRGAVGVISDCVSPPWLVSHPPVREPEDVPDLTMWTIFSGSRNDTPLWGFSLSARQGRRLRKIISETKEPVILRAIVDAELVEGYSELVNAVLPGTDLAHEEIWVLAHSSEPGARDNASGCCLSIEIARTIKRLIENDLIPPLRRTIRFLNAVEVSGFLPYIDSRLNDLDNVIAGLCLDSVGQDFSICGGELVLFQSPETNASFVDGLLGHLIETVRALPNNLFSSDNYAIFPWHTEPFWGNDAFISDGFFDIPTPQLSTWPDKFYHSSMDRPEQMSDNTLGRIGVIVGTYLYLLATAKANEAIRFAGMALRDWKQRICNTLIDEALKNNEASAEDIMKLSKHLGFQAKDAITQLVRFDPQNEEFIKSLRRMSNCIYSFALQEGDRAIELSSLIRGKKYVIPAQNDEESERDNRTYKRLRWGIPPESSFSESARMKLEAMKKFGNVHKIWEWINGRRSSKEIWERVQFKENLPYDVVSDYLQLLVDEGFVIVKERI